MGGVIGFVSKQDCVMDLFFGTDYHSHLGNQTRRNVRTAGQDGFNRSIHNIENSPFRSKFEADIEEMEGKMGIGAISDGDPQPLTVHSRQGDYAITTVGRINNKDEIVKELLEGQTETVYVHERRRHQQHGTGSGARFQRERTLWTASRIAQAKDRRFRDDAGAHAETGFTRLGTSTAERR